MSFALNELQDLIRNWSEDGNFPDKVADAIMDRICQIRRNRREGGNSIEWHADLQPLLRQVLLRIEKLGDNVPRLRVPADQGWPDRQSWIEHGFDVLEVGARDYLLNAREWHPEWLEPDEGGVFSDAFSNQVVRQERPCPADPFISDATGFKSYSCPGQREAVRAAFLLPEGDTLLVNLPTGSGKSLVGQAPALVHNEDGHVTVFVVPTVALALDQERAMRVMFERQKSSAPDWPLAWFGDSSQEDRAEIRRRLRNGTQRILFTSPEALTTSLLRVILDTASAGMLRYLVIDEAHLITQWGDEFRPSFQALAGLRHSMLKVAPRGFRTLLMSATFTEETVDTLANLFGPRDRVQMVSAVHLRPEPQYWFYGAKSLKEKQERILDALRHAPRPFILYVTKREEVAQWNALLRRDARLSRIATFDGRTPNSDRRRIINEWSKNRLDGIVATSAFGVGLDKNDVRTVIHATIPETLDRFYQEVGRGGRDGRASASLMIYEPSDWILPERLAKPKIISDQLGFARWKKMYELRRPTDEENLWDIDIDAVHSGLPGGSEYNVDWNMRTLLLMARAGLISLEIANNPIDTIDEIEENASSLLAAVANIRVRILEGGHLIPEHWEKAVSASRNATLQASERNLQMMRQLLPDQSGGLQQVGREVGETLAELYRINSQDWPVHVSHACGGCPRDRISGIRPSSYADPVTTPIMRVTPSSSAAWTAKFGWLDSPLIFVFYDEELQAESLRRQVVPLATWLTQACGIREILINPLSPIGQYPEWSSLYKRAEEKVLLHRTPKEALLEPSSPLARLTVLDSGAESADVLRAMMFQSPFHVVLLPLSMPEPRNNRRRLADLSPNGIRLDLLIQELNQ